MGPVFGNRKAPVSCSVGPDSGRDAGTPTAPAEALPKASPTAEFTWVVAMVGASTGGRSCAEDIRSSSSGVRDMAADTTVDTADKSDSRYNSNSSRDGTYTVVTVADTTNSRHNRTVAETASTKWLQWRTQMTSDTTEQ